MCSNRLRSSSSLHLRAAALSRCHARFDNNSVSFFRIAQCPCPLQPSSYSLCPRFVPTPGARIRVLRFCARPESAARSKNGSSGIEAGRLRPSHPYLMTIWQTIEADTFCIVMTHSHLIPVSSPPHHHLIATSSPLHRHLIATSFPFSRPGGSTPPSFSSTTGSPRPSRGLFHRPPPHYLASKASTGDMSGL